MNKNLLSIFIALFLIGATALWYFGHHLPNQKVLTAEPQRVYKPVPVLTPETGTPTQGSTESAAKAEDTQTAGETQGTTADNLAGDGSRSTAESPSTDQNTEANADLEAAILAEEEKAQEALTAEERRKREIKQRLKRIHAEICEILIAAGGKINGTTHPEEMAQLLRLTQEMAELIRQETAGTDKEEDVNMMVNMFGFMADFSQRFRNSMNSQGELPVSEALEMADFMETAGFGDPRSGKTLRLLAEQAIENGYDVIKPEQAGQLIEQLNEKFREKYEGLE